jgi:hypothetical protein
VRAENNEEMKINIGFKNNKREVKFEIYCFFDEISN